MGFCGHDLEDPLDLWEEEPLVVLDLCGGAGFGHRSQKTPLGRREGTENAVGTMPRVGEEP